VGAPGALRRVPRRLVRALLRYYFELLRSEAERLHEGQALYYNTAVEEHFGRVITGPVTLPPGLA
jgi:hypothetical protein